MCPSKIHLLRSNPQGDGIRWDLSDVVTSRGRAIMNGLSPLTEEAP